MSKLSKVDICWKILDTETGLFWNGYSTECSHAIGTRFARRSVLDDTVRRIIRDKGRFPKKWEVRQVKITEQCMMSIDSNDTMIDVSLDHLEDIFKDRGVPTSRCYKGVELIRSMRRQGELSTWPYIGLRQGEYVCSWPKFRAAMKPFGINHTRISNREYGWACFADKEAAIASRMNDALSQVFEVDELLIVFSRKTGIPKKAI